jgi:branched-chain amino acid transport system ATP-binding protein
VVSPPRHYYALSILIFALYFSSFIDAVFDILGNLQHNERKTIVMVEQNAKKGLEFSDIGYVLVSGKLALAGKASELLTDPDVGRLFLGG